MDTPRPSPRTDRTRLVPHPATGLSSEVESDLYAFHPGAPGTGGSLLTKVQTVRTKAAAAWLSFAHRSARYLFVAQEFDGAASSYVASSVLYRYTGGALIEWQSVTTAAITAMASFHVGPRTFLALANAADPTGDHKNGSIVVYEMVSALLEQRLRVTDVPGIVDMVPSLTPAGRSPYAFPYRANAPPRRPPPASSSASCPPYSCPYPCPYCILPPSLPP